MGMYNEIWVICPKCESHICAQIPQVTLGFGGFVIYKGNDCRNIAELSDEDKTLLTEYVNDTEVYCCGSFKPKLELVK